MCGLQETLREKLERASRALSVPNVPSLNLNLLMCRMYWMMAQAAGVIAQKTMEEVREAMAVAISHLNTKDTTYT
jgi:hypothetical protein